MFGSTQSPKQKEIAPRASFKTYHLLAISMFICAWCFGQDSTIDAQKVDQNNVIRNQKDVLKELVIQQNMFETEISNLKDVTLRLNSKMDIFIDHHKEQNEKKIQFSALNEEVRQLNLSNQDLISELTTLKKSAKDCEEFQSNKPLTGNFLHQLILFILAIVVLFR